jgi:WD40 repeat protein/serine/threonine protein kinase
MTGESVKHPAEDELLAFGLGKLDPAEAEKIAEHLDSCRDCSETIVGLEDDTFVSLVRNSLAPSPTEQSDSQPAKVPLSPEATVDVASGLTDGSSELADLPRELCEHARYEILELIGRGGMGDVYTAQHKVMNRVVALKVIKPELVQNETAVGRFQREVQAAARLHHGNIVTAYDAEQAGDLHYLVMEFVDGVNLDEVIHDRGSLPVAEACKYVQQAAEGLQHAHELGMVHRDIKPHNLMVASSGQVKILDFGLANFANEVAADEATDSIEEDRASAIGAIRQLTQMGTMMGTPDYIAPEQARDAHEADIRADIYSLGCTFYTLLAGKAPFAEGSILEKIKAHAEQEAPQLVNFRDDVPSEVEAVLLKMTAKDPAARYQTPAEVAEALKSAARQASQPVTESVAKPRHGGSRPRRTWAAAISLVLLMVLLPLTYFFGGTVIHFVTNQGVLVVEVNDKNVEVVIRDQDGLVLRDRSTEREFTLKAVEGEIEVYEAGSNLRLFTKKFTLSRGGKEYVRIKALELAESRNRAGGSDDPKQIGDATHPSSSEARAAITEVRRFEGHTGTVKSVAISPDGKFAASASGWPHGDKSLRLWNLATGEEVRQFKGHTDQVMRVAFSWDGRRLVSGSADHTARAWDAATGKQIAVLSDHEGLVQAFAFGPDSNTVWTAPTTSDGKGKIRHWLFEADEVYTNFDRGNGRVIDMAVSPDGQRLITGNDSSVRIWNMRGQLLRTVASPANQVESLAFSHDGRYFAVAAMSGKWIHVHDAVSGAVFRTLVGTEGMRSVAFTLDNRHIVAAGLAGVVHVWDVQTGKEIARSEELTEIIWSVAVSPDGRTVLTGGGSKRVGQGEFERGSDFALRLWQLPESVRPQVTEVCSFEGHDGRGSNGRLAVSPDGTLIATYQSGTVLIWDVGSAKQKYIVRTGEMSIASVVFLDHDPPMIAIGTADVGRRLDSPGSVLIWDLESNKLHRQLSTVG